MFAWHLKRMASTKRPPKVSKISRAPTVAFARKQRPTGEVGAADGEPDDESAPEPATAAKDAPKDAPKDAAKASSPAITPPTEPASKPAAPAPEPAAPEIARARVETVVIPAHASLGSPPAMPPDAAVVAPPADVSAPEAPTQMPGPREIPPGNPDDPAQPPGLVPSGDSRSLRRRTDRYEFALVYRRQTFVITRHGAVGTRGQWKVVEYPTLGAAGNAYARECSRFAADGFSDYRE
jgi:hypothetical protein